MIIPVSIITSLVYILELVFCFLEKEKLRKIVKPFCLTMVICLLITLKLKEIYVYAALIFLIQLEVK